MHMKIFVKPLPVKIRIKIHLFLKYSGVIEIFTRLYLVAL